MTIIYTRVLPARYESGSSDACEHFSGVSPFGDILALDHLMRGSGGRMIILPPSFTGSPRYMQGLYKDAMAIELLHLIIDKEIFGKVKGRVYVVEFQKCGLPHAHMLWILDEPYKPRTPEDIDKIVCAKLPDPSEELLDYVAAHMIHGPCHLANPRCPCIKNEKCSKKFPKEFISSTQVNNDGYPLYLRRNNGRVVQKVKYLYKYVYKGDDRIQAKLSSKVPPMDDAIAACRKCIQLCMPFKYTMIICNPWSTQKANQLVMSWTGARCYEDLRTVDDVVDDTYQSDAEALGLLHSDAEFDNDLALASAIASPRQIRELFAMILLYYELSQPDVLFEKYLDAMSDDFRLENCASQVTNQIRKKVLRALDSILYHNGTSLASYPVLPQLVELPLIDTRCSPSHGNNIQNAMIAAEHLRDMLNVEQRQLYDAVFEAIESTHCAKEAKVFFFDGPGGSGKTFLYSAILAKIKASRLTAIPTATSGITSASIIIVDEAPMMHRHVYETLDQSIRDVMNTIDATLENVPFGGKVVVMGGDFRQMLPVIQKGSRSMIICLSLNRSDVWRHCSIFCLKTNVRVSPKQQAWSEFLLAVGEGRVCHDVHLPAEMQRVSALLDLIAQVYGTFEDSATLLVTKTILTPLNIDVVRVNNMVLDVFPGEVMEYFSFDAIHPGEVNNESLYPTEFLNTIDDATMPLHELRLKICCIMILLRNLNTRQGLCNKTRLRVDSFFPSMIQATIISQGNFDGDVHLLPRIALYPSQSRLPFQFKRLQFPVRLAFSMTINKSQGQTLDTVGLCLPNPFFTHGQLYVALSRTRIGPTGIIFCDGTANCLPVTNIVYKEAEARIIDVNTASAKLSHRDQVRLPFLPSPSSVYKLDGGDLLFDGVLSLRTGGIDVSQVVIF
ncbi:uncharacterized protein LOC144700161 [Wolffia australiana]